MNQDARRAAARRLDGRVVVVAAADTDTGAAAVVLVGDDAGALGRLAADLLVDGGRAAIFVGDPRDDQERAELAELVAELFARDEPEPRG